MRSSSKTEAATGEQQQQQKQQQQEEQQDLTLSILSQTLCLSMSLARAVVLKLSVHPNSANPTTECTATPSIKNTKVGKERMRSLLVKKGAFSAFILRRTNPKP